MERTEKDRVFKDNLSDKIEFVSLKVAKLTAALYLVTSNFADQDPLKWRLRRVSLDILEQAKQASRRPLENGTCLFDQAIDSIGRILSLIEISLLYPGVSQMNLSILQKEYQELRARMVQVGGIESASFESTELISPPRFHAKVSPPTSKIMISNTPHLINSRQEQIVRFLKDNDWSSIKDISRILPEVSSKTVQRDLAQLVAQGKLEREGDRRWSRYRLSTNHSTLT